MHRHMTLAPSSHTHYQTLECGDTSRKVTINTKDAIAMQKQKQNKIIAQPPRKS